MCNKLQVVPVLRTPRRELLPDRPGVQSEKEDGMTATLIVVFVSVFLTRLVYEVTR